MQSQNSLEFSLYFLMQLCYLESNCYRNLVKYISVLFLFNIHNYLKKYKGLLLGIKLNYIKSHCLT